MFIFTRCCRAVPAGFALPDASKDTTIIDVEPNSGTITHYDEGLEINVYLVLLLGPPQNILPPPWWHLLTHVWRRTRRAATSACTIRTCDGASWCRWCGRASSA